MQRKKRAKDSATWHQSRGKRERAALALRSPVERVRELIGSLAISGGVAALVSLLLVVLADARLDGPMLDWAPLYAWLTGITTLGAWTVLIAGKAWESKSEDQVIRRFTMMGIGILLGAIAWGLSQGLMVDLTEAAPAQGRHVSPGFASHLQTANGQATIGAFLLYFASLMVVLRWWRLADPLRKARLSLWKTGLCVLAALILNAIFPFAQPWGLMLAGAISLAVQLSAPWLNSNERDQLRRQYEQTAQETMASKG